MDNAQKAIMIGVGLFITIIVIAAVMLITGIGQDLLNSGTQQLGGISESLRTQIIDQYDGKKITGAQVKTAAVDLVSRNDPSIKVAIDAKKVDSTETARSGVTNTQKYTGEVIYDSDSGIAYVNFYTTSGNSWSKKEGTSKPVDNAKESFK